MTDAEIVERRLRDLLDRLHDSEGRDVPHEIYVILCEIIGILRLMNREHMPL